jgi:hypothetical protein
MKELKKQRSQQSEGLTGLGLWPSVAHPVENCKAKHKQSTVSPETETKEWKKQITNSCAKNKQY